jgi:hypothetical protein
MPGPPPGSSQPLISIALSLKAAHTVAAYGSKTSRIAAVALASPEVVGGGTCPLKQLQVGLGQAIARRDSTTD